MQPIHGDAHLHNVINGPDGPLWNDWEDCFSGPRALGPRLPRSRPPASFDRDPAAGRGSPRRLRDGASVDERRSTCSSSARRYQGIAVSILMAREQPTRERRERSERLLAVTTASAA